MANLTAVTVELNVQGEREATAALKNFQSEQAKLSTSVLGSARKLESINSRWAEADRLLSKGTISTKAHAAAQKQLGRELAALNGMYDTQGRLLTRQATNQLKSAQAAQQASQAQAQYAQRMEELRMRLDPVYRASQQYKQSLRELIQVQRSGSMSMDDYRKNVQLLKQEFQRVSQGGRGVRRSMSNVNIAVQQAGFQFSDFAIQVQSGTNMFVAFSQQASQLVGVLPLVARDIGLSAKMAVGLASGLGLAIPLLSVAGSVLVEMATGAKEAEKSVDALQEAISSANRAINIHEMNIVELTDKYGLLGLAVRDSSLAIAKADFRSAYNDLRDTAIPVLDELLEATELYRASEPFSFESNKAAEQIKDIRDQLDLTAAETGSLATAFERLNSANTFEGQVQAALDLKNVMESIPESVLQTDSALNKAVKEVNELFAQSAELQRAMEKLEGSAPGSNWMDNAIRGVKSLYDNIVAAIKGADALNDKTSDRPDAFKTRPRLPGVDSSFGETGNPLASIRPRLPGVDFGASGSGSGRGGGGASQEQTAAEYIQSLEREAALRRRLIGLSEEERERAERRFEIQEKVIELEGDISQERIDQLLNEEQRINRLTELEEKRQDQVKQMESSFDSFFMSVFDDIDSLEDAFHAMLRSLLRDAYQSTISPVSESLSSGLSDFIGGIFGGGWGSKVFNIASRFAGPFDSGGTIPSGMFGLVGERRPEFVQGPATVTGGAETARMLSASPTVNVPVQVNIQKGAERDEVRRRRGPNGQQVIDVAVSDSISSGRQDGSLGGRFGSEPRQVRR